MQKENSWLNAEEVALNINDYIVPANKKYYDEILSLDYSVELVLRKGLKDIWQNHEADAIFTRKLKKIVAPENNLNNIEAFTHQLLHIYCEVVLEMHWSIKDIMKLHVANNPLLAGIVAQVFPNIINNLHKQKMLPLFLECGFKKESFLINYTESTTKPYNTANLHNYRKDLSQNANRLLYAIYIADALAYTQFPLNEIVSINYQNVYNELLEIEAKDFESRFTKIFTEWDKGQMKFREMIEEMISIILVFTNSSIEA